MTIFTVEHVLVIGGSSGMGRGAWGALAAQGAELTVTSRSAERVPAAVAAVREGIEPVGSTALDTSPVKSLCSMAGRR